MKKLLLLPLILLIFGCSSNQYATHYNDEGLDRADFIPLKSGENVKIVETLNPETRLQEYKKQGYVLIGSARFNSEWIPFSKAISFAKEKGATLIIFGTENIGRDTKHYSMALPQTNTVYHSGSASAYGSGGYEHATYSGTSTYTTTQYISGSHNVTLFRQTVLFLAKSSDALGGN